MTYARTILIGAALALGLMAASPEKADAQYRRSYRPYGSSYSPYRYGYSPYRYGGGYGYGYYRPSVYSYGYAPSFSNGYYGQSYNYNFYGVGPNYWNASPYPRYNY